MAPPHTMQFAGRADWALMIAIHGALRRDLERHGGRTPAGVHVRVAQRLLASSRVPPEAKLTRVHGHGRPTASWRSGFAKLTQGNAGSSQAGCRLT